MRPSGWEMRMAAAIEAAQDREWAWGSHDCASFAARVAADILQGPPVWAEYLGRHDDARGAIAVLRAAGVSCLGDLMDTRANRIPAAYARRGDVAAIRLRGGLPDPDGRIALAIVEGETVVTAASPRGLARSPRSLVVAAWPVEAADG